jgi:hypothetical protein
MTSKTVVPNPAIIVFAIFIVIPASALQLGNILPDQGPICPLVGQSLGAI